MKGAREMNNEPVAIRYNFDGYGYQYIDSGTGSDWQTRVKGEPLYTTPPQRTKQKPVACERCKQLEEHAYDLVGKLRVANIKLSIRPQRTWAGLMRGVRVEGDTVVITVKGGNEAARELCGALIEEMNK